jgi:hypothetical protein
LVRRELAVAEKAQEAGVDPSVGQPCAFDRENNEASSLPIEENYKPAPAAGFTRWSLPATPRQGSTQALLAAL